MLSEKGRGTPPQKLKAMAFLSAAAENLQLLKVPDVIFGFKVKDAALAKRQLKLWEKLIRFRRRISGVLAEVIGSP